MPGMLVILIHILSCIAICAGIRSGHLLADRALLPMAVLVPFWGEICVLMIHWEAVRERAGKKSAQLEELRRGQEQEMDILHSEEAEEVVVPLEDALLINDPSVRRSMMMDMLMKDVTEHFDILHAARMNEDVEVVHYATTAMSELAKDFDFRLQKLEVQYKEDPSDIQILQEYLKFLEQYIKSGLIQGQLLKIQKEQYLALLRRKTHMEGTREDYRKLIRGYLEQGALEEAEKPLEEMEERWPEHEDTWLLKIEFAFQEGQGRTIQELIRQIGEKNIFLSAEGRACLDYWRV